MAVTTMYFADGFNHYDTDNILLMWDAHYDASIESTTPRRTGVDYLKLLTAYSYITKNLPSSTNTIAVGFGLRAGALTTHSGFRLYNADGCQACVYINSDGSICVTTGVATATIETSSPGLFRSTTWNWIEFKITIGDAGSYEVKLNGQSILSGSGDTQDQTSSGCTQVQLWGISDSLYVADLYFADDYFGDTQIDTLFSNGAGNYSQFTPSAGSNYECVDEAAPDGDTTYVKSSTVNHKDSYTYDDLPTVNGTIYAVVAVIAAKKDEVDTRSFRAFTRLSSTDYNGSTTHYLSQGYKYYLEEWLLNPATSLAWVKADIDGAEFGCELLS